MSLATTPAAGRPLASRLLVTSATVVGLLLFFVLEIVVNAAIPVLVVLWLVTLGLAPSALLGRFAPLHQLPPNIRTTDELRPLLVELLSRSSTFREQCARIGRARQTYVSVRLIRGKLPSATRARSIARRYQSGLLLVDVEIPPASRDLAELLAHELEHVNEFIDHVDFQQLARDRRSGVVRCGVEESFETERARKAGLTVAAEAARPR